jgi:hypothetical protein
VKCGLFDTSRVVLPESLGEMGILHSAKPRGLGFHLKAGELPFITPEHRVAVDDRRGYNDIGPERAWEDWACAFSIESPCAEWIARFGQRLYFGAFSEVFL